ncbi:mobilome CxxCx(11)CxxC protein [Mucilaginibacter sp. SG538B]|uniref:mobilome CxxCx(11)CxxC protein n=1 Tax=Mucilaginibacter sp. SG538B TaxID=2587021 RepID=UPI00159E15B8|nr:mobilome CxxCx(11)CxxC protein [Mucilaginibacter sp. SG538B]NVM64498.1 mobilome CxxCx(11)CxxC protein [Mucilaginibacter sp. SG538B]
MTTPNIDELKRSCHEKAFHLYGTAFIYGVRAREREKYTQAITLLGVMIPVLVGAVVTSYGLDSPISSIFLKILTPIAVFQLVLSTLALVYKWDDKKSYYLESSISNRQLAEDFTHLAKFPSQEITETIHAYEIIITKAQSREDQDDRYPFTSKEFKKGMRYSLRQYQKVCSGCGIVPVSMEPSDCEICGNF